ncbi:MULTISPECIES: heavy metal translocating P-type ATPase [unclassified Enterococcus]|uniref:heavy metal translocating P-type ATPase n=1 Tax=unclassified Enterococcus TaxID=2608891 RepID=UPI0013EA1F9C|nr:MULTISPECIES: heavy metal translocating P-type ATPase [unclassified Enterococcus]
MEKPTKKAFIATIGCLVLIVLGLFVQQLNVAFTPLFYIGAIIIGGYKQTSEGLSELWNHRTLNVDLLMALAAIGACLIGNYFEGAMLTFIFCLSGALEEYTTSKSQKEITALMNLQPQTAQRFLSDGELEEIDVSKLNINDRVFVAKGAAIPIDGVLESDQAAIDEAAISGESIPIEKRLGDEVYAGTLNQGNPLTLRVTKTSSETVFAKIIQLVEEAQNTPTQTASFIERIENTYVKLILISVPLMILLPHYFLGWSWEESFYRGMVLLVVASPCALVASATPASLAALSNSAKNGILIKGGIYLEQLSELKAIAFDKTGTLTRGKPVVTDTFFFKDQELAQQILVAMEKKTTHPLASAILNHFDLQLPKEIQQLPIEEVTGFGLKTRYQEAEWKVGKHAYDPKKMNVTPATKEKIKQLEEQGKTVIFLSRDDELIAVLGLLDIPKPNTKNVISYFRAQNIHTSMITGDNVGTAKAIAEQVGINHCYAGCTPSEKTAQIQKEKEQYKVNAMVGDGVNDAPALAAASIGVAMGQGTDAAMDIADIVLIKNDLSKLAYSHRLSLKMRRIIKQNIVFSVSVIVLLILSNFLQFLNLPLGVVGHEGSTILVILNGLRLLRPLPMQNKKEKRCASCPLYKANFLR